MLLILTDESIYHDIADAIRERFGTSETFLPSEMADAIRRAWAAVMPFEALSQIADIPSMACLASCHGLAQGASANADLGYDMPFTLKSTAGKAV